MSPAGEQSLKVTVSKEDWIDLILGVIAKRAAERGSLLTKIRLVKFLYLLDLFWAQANRGQTFTGWPWAFVHYGPYCGESIAAITRADKYGFLAADKYESKYRDEDYLLYKSGYRVEEAEDREVRSMLPMYVSSNLFSHVDRWCNDTYGLLDYVYFHTGPMSRARPGERLSFEKEEKVDYTALQPVKLVPLGPEKKKLLRDVLDKMKKERSLAAAEAPPSVSLYDDAYFAALAALKDEETPIGVSGTASVVYVPPDDDD